MYKKSRRPILFLFSCFVLGGMCLLTASPVHADVGVQPILPDGSNIQPGEETPIQMSAEKVVFKVRQATEWDREGVIYNPMAYELQNHMIPIWQHSVAEVNAFFMMNNPTSQAVSMTVWFPLASALESDEWESHPREVAPRIENFRVLITGEPVSYNINELPNPKGADFPLLPWANFPVTFPAGQDTLIEVSYLIWAQPDLSGVGMFFSYIFQTGAGWAGPIGKAELVVNLPYTASPETIGKMPGGEVYDGCRVSWTWENFEPTPEDDFTIWLINQERWEELEAARMRVINWPDGESYLNLADIYRRLILGKYQILPGFGEIYTPMGVQAAQEAKNRLPGDGRPHYELAIFYLAGLPANPSEEDIAPLLDELRWVAKLAPSYEGDVRDWMEFKFDSSLWESLNKKWAEETEAAAAISIPSITPAQPTFMTLTPLPYNTPVPTAITASITPVVSEVEKSKNLSLILVGITGLIGWVLAMYLFLKRKS